MSPLKMDPKLTAEQQALLQAIRDTRGRIWYGLLTVWLRENHGFEGTLKFPTDVAKLTAEQAKAALLELPEVTTESNGSRDLAISTLLKERSGR